MEGTRSGSRGGLGQGHRGVEFVSPHYPSPLHTIPLWLSLDASTLADSLLDSGVPHLEALPPPLPAVNQIELHPWCQQRPIVSYCQKKGIAIEAYSPLVQANKKRFQDPVLLKICEKQNKDQAQILIRWSLQKGYICIPKSVNPGRIKSNANVFDFELDKADVEALDGLDEGSKGAVTWNPVDSP